MVRGCSGVLLFCCCCLVVAVVGVDVDLPVFVVCWFVVLSCC